MNDAEMAAVNTMATLYLKKIQEFFNVRLPGLIITDVVSTLIWLMTSKNPDQGQIL